MQNFWWVLCEFRVSGHFDPNIIQEKSAIFTNILNYTKSPCIIFCTKLSQYCHYTNCLQEESTHLVSGYRHIWSRGIETVWLWKSQTKSQQYSQRFFKLYQLYMNNFLCQTVPKSSFCMLPKLLTTWLAQFCVITYPRLFIPD